MSGVNQDPKKGLVALVGGGPGDPGLLTVKAREAIKEADVIVYDHLVNPSILSLAKGEAQLIYVGKEAGRHTLSQEEINRLLVEKAKEGLFVVRLKGGDPFVFGRGGEELEELAAYGVDFRVIPGISSAMAVPAYAGIPLTHRDYASSVAFVTGHEREEKTESTIRWEHLGKGVDTLVFLMGMGNAGLISQRLMENGRSPETPVAVIQNGTTPSQRTLLTQLSKLEGEIKERGFKPPGIIVVGEVVRLSERLNWFEGLPLFDRKIVITRPKEQGEEMAEILRRAGADVIQFPTIEIAPPDSSEGLDMAIGSIETFDLVIFTSANGVKGFFQRLFQKGLDSRILKGIRIVCIGPKTSLELLKYGIMADLIPGEFRAEGIVEALSRNEIEGKRILIPRAQEAREVLAEALKNMGGEIYEEPAYKTTIPQGINLNSTKAIFSEPPDLITFTSSSTVRNLIEILKMAHIDLNPITEESIAACIGPITSQTASKVGFKHIIQAERYTAESLLEKIFYHFEGYLPQSKRR